MMKNISQEAEIVDANLSPCFRYDKEFCPQDRKLKRGSKVCPIPRQCNISLYASATISKINKSLEVKKSYLFREFLVYHRYLQTGQLGWWAQAMGTWFWTGRHNYRYIFWRQVALTQCGEYMCVLNREKFQFSQIFWHL